MFSTGQVHTSEVSVVTSQCQVPLPVKDRDSAGLYVLCLCIYLSVCHIMGTPNAAPIVTKLGQQMLHSTTLSAISSETDLRTKSRCNVTFTACRIRMYQ